jgi:hypothetical protein
MPAWGLTMAAFKINLPFASYGFEIVKCFMGAFILRSSACTVNDIIDRNMDAGVGMNCCIFKDISGELTSSCPRTYTTQASTQRSRICICRYCLSDIAIYHRDRILLPCILGSSVSYLHYISPLIAVLILLFFLFSLSAALTQLLPM